MTTFIAIMGWITVVLLGLIALCITIVFICCTYKWITYWFYEKAYAVASRDIAGSIQRASWWFSEDESTMWCLQILAARVVNGTICSEGWRDEWRKMIAGKGAANE